MRPIVTILMTGMLLLLVPSLTRAERSDLRGSGTRLTAQASSREQDLRRWWQNLSPEERQRLRALRERWQALSPEQQQAVRERLGTGLFATDYPGALRCALK